MRVRLTRADALPPSRERGRSLLPWNGAPLDYADAAAEAGLDPDEAEAMAWALQQQELEDADE
jgi:hypothetical protein